jgi:hypothetical protein
MRQIDGAAQQWALEKGKKSGDTITMAVDLTPYIKLNSMTSIPGCPAGGSYSVGTVGAIPQVTCSLAATVTPPHQMP